MANELRTPPQIEPTREWLDERAALLIGELESHEERGRRPGFNARLLTAAAVVVLLCAGAAVAASGLDPLGWLRSGNPGEARFSVDPTRTITEEFASNIACKDPGDSKLACSPGSTGQWVYDLYYRVEAEPSISRESALAAVAELAERGILSASEAADLRARIVEVEDDFFVRMSVVRGLSSIGSAHVDEEGMVLVPPATVPQFITCRSGAGGLVCSELARTEGVPIGAPVYGLRESDDWVRQPYEPTVPQPDATVESVFGRKFTPTEELLLRTMRMAGAAVPDVGSNDIETATTDSDQE